MWGPLRFRIAKRIICLLTTITSMMHTWTHKAIIITTIVPDNCCCTAIFWKFGVFLHFSLRDHYVYILCHFSASFHISKSVLLFANKLFEITILKFRSFQREMGFAPCIFSLFSFVPAELTSWHYSHCIWSFWSRLAVQSWFWAGKSITLSFSSPAIYFSNCQDNGLKL